MAASTSSLTAMVGEAIKFLVRVPTSGGSGPGWGWRIRASTTFQHVRSQWSLGWGDGMARIGRSRHGVYPYPLPVPAYFKGGALLGVDAVRTSPG
eukprot:755025-Hanusia_phi.AAC.2